MLRLEPLWEGRNPPTDLMGNTGGLSPRDGASTELVTLEGQVCMPMGLLRRKGCTKTKHAGAEERDDRQPSRTGEEQTTPEK